MPRPHDQLVEDQDLDFIIGAANSFIYLVAVLLQTVDRLGEVPLPESVSPEALSPALHEN